MAANVRMSCRNAAVCITSVNELLFVNQQALTAMRIHTYWYAADRRSRAYRVSQSGMDGSGRFYTFASSKHASEQRRITNRTDLASGQCIHEPFSSFALERVNDEGWRSCSDALTSARLPPPRTRLAFVLLDRTSPCPPHVPHIALAQPHSSRIGPCGAGSCPCSTISPGRAVRVHGIRGLSAGVWYMISTA